MTADVVISDVAIAKFVAKPVQFPLRSIAGSAVAEYQQRWIELLRSHRVIAVIRAETVEAGVNMAVAAAAGGIHLLEITWNSYQPVALLQAVQRQLPHCTVGVGTLFTEEDLGIAIATGAQFCFSPHTSPALMRHSQTVHVPMVPGAMTPTEIITAVQAGAATVKLFPIKTLGGAAYIRCLQGPMGRIPMIPSGGVILENTAALLRAGAIAVGVSSGLFAPQDVSSQSWSHIEARAAQFVAAGRSAT